MMKEMPARFHAERSEREREREKEISFEASVTTLYNVTPKSSRVGFAFSEHWAGCAVPNRREREREGREGKSASINSRSAGSRRSLFLLRTTNLALLPNLSSTSSQLSTRKRSLVVFPPSPLPPPPPRFASTSLQPNLGV